MRITRKQHSQLRQNHPISLDKLGRPKQDHKKVAFAQKNQAISIENRVDLPCQAINWGWAKLYLHKCLSDRSQLTVTISRRVANASKRNRIRRCFMASLIEHGNLREQSGKQKLQIHIIVRENKNSLHKKENFREISKRFQSLLDLHT